MTDDMPTVTTKVKRNGALNWGLYIFGWMCFVLCALAFGNPFMAVGVLGIAAWATLWTLEEENKDWCTCDKCSKRVKPRKELPYRPTEF